MTVRIYIAKDSEGRGRAPDTSHEVSACEWMLGRAWLEFHHLQELYAIVVNLRHPSADMAIFTERGLGLIELKHKYGEIRISPDGRWLANSTFIESGKHLNPREQVRSYAKELRAKTISWILPPYMQTSKDRWDKLKFQTAVCFTHPNVNILNAQKYLNMRHVSLESWESNFSIIDLKSFTPWIRGLRFQLQNDPGYAQDFEHVRLSPNRIIKVVGDILRGIEWEEMYAAMPTGQPYGYLILEDLRGRQVFRLVADHLTIGRSPDCSIVIPERYSRVSKEHCTVNRDINSITVTDLDSRNGIFINGIPIRKPTRITHGDVIFLGGASAHEKVCVLRLEIFDHASLLPYPTETET